MTKKICSVEDCERDATARGLCNKHYSRWLRTGSVYGASGRANAAALPANILTVAEAAKEVGASRSAIQSAIVEKRLPAKKYFIDGIGYINGIAREDALEYKARPKHRAATEKEFCTWNEENTNCQELAIAHQLCFTHYQHARTTAKYEAKYIPPENHPPRCLVMSCHEPQYAKGLCRNHKAQLDRNSPLLFEFDVEFEEAPDRKTVGGRIKIERLRRGWSLRELGERIGVSHERIRQVEASSNVTEQMAAKIAMALDMKLEALVPPDAKETLLDEQNKQLRAQIKALRNELDDKDREILKLERLVARARRQAMQTIEEF